MALEPTVLWHDTLSTWKERNSFLFNKNFMSDCSFIVTENGTSTRIPAHKYILGGFSLDFYNLFYLMEAESNEIPITDVSLKSFTDFLNYVYSEKTLLSQGTVWDVLKLAHRYSAYNLKKYCEEAILKMILKSNCIEIMDRCAPYQISSVTSKCLQLMDPKYICSPSFCDIKLETLESILKVEESCISEIDLFRAANKWAIRKCERMNIVPNGDNKRMVLGAAVMHIRFASMTVEELAECTDTHSILTGNEGLQVFRFIGNGGTSECIFSGINRFKPILRVISLLTVGGTYVQVGPHDLSGDPFKMSLNINDQFRIEPQTIRGFGVQLNYFTNTMPSLMPKQENITIKLLDCDSKVLLENVCTVTIVNGEVSKVFDLLFKVGYKLRSGVTYSLEFELNKVFITNNLMIPRIQLDRTDLMVIQKTCFTKHFPQQHLTFGNYDDYNFLSGTGVQDAHSSIVRILFDK